MSIARVYEYGLLEPTVNADLVADQMHAAHRYRNVLVEIERARRDAVRAALAAHPSVEPIEAEVARLAAEREVLRDQIRRANAAKRGRADTKELREQVRDVAGRLREARGRLKAAKDAIAEDVVVTAAIAVANERAAARVREERAHCNCYWSTYLLQEADADRARKEKTPPKFRRWTGEGRVSVQLQGGIALDDLWGADTQAQIVAGRPIKEGGCVPPKARTLRLRVQSDDRGKPVWAEWPMILHRPLPDGCRIKSATVHRRRRDCRQWDWRLTLQVELADGWTQGRCGTGVVALNLGYARSYDHLRGAVRAGYLVGADGDAREVTVAASVIDRVEASEAIRSHRDKNLDVMRPALVTWLREHEAELPAWLVERTILSKRRGSGVMQEQLGALAETTNAARSGQVQEAAALDPTIGDEPPKTDEAVVAPDHTIGDESPLPQTQEAAAAPGRTVGDEVAIATRNWHVALWRSAARFRALAFAWRKDRFAGDEAGYDLIESWRYRDEHLQRYEAGMLRGALLDRREKYRLVAAELAARYATLVVGSTDLRELQRSPRPEEARTEIAGAKRNQRHAAGSVLRAVLENAFRRRGGKVVVVDDARATSTCHACGSIEEWDRIAQREHTCGGCGATWDQDENHSKNLLARYRREQEVERLEGGTARDGKSAEKKESRSQRLRRTRWQKKEGEIARDA